MFCAAQWQINKVKRAHQVTKFKIRFGPLSLATRVPHSYPTLVWVWCAACSEAESTRLAAMERAVKRFGVSDGKAEIVRMNEVSHVI